MTVAGKILDLLMETKEAGEWGSISLNVTDGPEEGPVIVAAILPGTTKENAIRIQNGCAELFGKLNA